MLLAGACGQAGPEIDAVDSEPAGLVSAAAGGIKGSKPGRRRPTGCRGQVCADQTVSTTCAWREEYACYGDHGVCERDASGQCGWR